MSDEIRPFLSTIASVPAAPRSFGSAIKAIPVAPVHSPWLPQGTQPGVTSTQIEAAPVDTQAIEDEAREAGHAQGLAETAELRAQLAQAITVFTAARTAVKAPVADKIAAAAAAVIATWTQAASPKELYAPIVAAWFARSTGPATAYVASAHVQALTEIIAEAQVEGAIEVHADAAMRSGDLRLSSTTLELSHSWDTKLPALRDAIAAALESAS